VATNTQPHATGKKAVRTIWIAIIAGLLVAATVIFAREAYHRSKIAADALQRIEEHGQEIVNAAFSRTDRRRPI
jgi:hypothetical protein